MPKQILLGSYVYGGVGWGVRGYSFGHISSDEKLRRAASVVWQPEVERKTKAAKNGSCEKAGYNDTHNEQRAGGNGTGNKSIKGKATKKK